LLAERPEHTNLSLSGFRMVSERQMIMTKYIIKHRNKCYFNLAVPNDLLSPLGKSKITDPLSVSLEEASILKHERLLYCKRQFKDIRESGVTTFLATPTLTTDLSNLITSYLQPEEA